MSVRHQKVAILDAGSQYGKIIDRKVRELNIYSELLPLQTTAAKLKDTGFDAIIISGGPQSVHTEGAIKFDPLIFELNVPVLGICYGMQLMVQVFGGAIDSTSCRDDGQFDIIVDCTCPIFADLTSNSQTVLLTHGDSVLSTGGEFKTVGKLDNLVVAIANESKKFYGLQFHPEVDLTDNGKTMLRSFLFRICGLTGSYTVTNRESLCIDEIKEKVGTSKVLVLVSGGVDSTVLAALCYKALNPEQVIALHVDNGFMRKHESERVVKALKHVGVPVKLITASNTFYNSTTTLQVKQSKGKERKLVTRVLCQTSDPEEKRKIIGDTFMHIVNFQTQEHNLTLEDCFLAQGTLRPDLIESASHLVSNNADAIKTHHNDTQLVRQLRAKGRVIEPLKDFHKDEVRELGTQLGLPADIVMRHPFPGPGLAIRVICADEPYISTDFTQTQTMLRLISSYSHSISKPHALLQKIHAALESERDRNKLKILTERFPVKATLLPIKSVGVQGDGRTYSYVVGLSSNSEPDWEALFFLAKMIPRVCHNVNRVTYVFGKAVTDQIQDITPTTLSFNVLSTLRQCDWVANSILEKHKLMRNISQMPVVLLPLHFERDMIVREPSCQRCVVLRPFITNDFMTGLPAVPGNHLPEAVVMEMAQEVKKVHGIDRVLYDLTSKPPGTTEWE